MRNLDLSQFNFTIDNPGPLPSAQPLQLEQHLFVTDDQRTVVDSDYQSLRSLDSFDDIASMETAGPRAEIFHPPYLSRAAIVTCGGLCPGLNSVIKGIVETLHSEYGVREIYGIPFGYAGLADPESLKPKLLDPDGVDTIHMEGGSILGTSRGSQDMATMVQNLVNMRINMLFAIGGDGTLKGAQAIAQEIKKQNYRYPWLAYPKQ